MNIKYKLLIVLAIAISSGYSQDTSKYKLHMNLSVVHVAENFELPYSYPSMKQAFEWSNNLYEVSYYGIDELGNKIFGVGRNKLVSSSFKYIMGLAFAKYGSELPIPLGVWAHEEFHRAVLGANDISSKNGNWLLTRWDGTVYGVSDEDLSNLKSENLSNLLYAYVSGVQYEIELNRHITITDFFHQRSHYKNALLLYNSWYVYDYFRFSASDKSDSVKTIAPDDESPDPVNRDFAGADLTAWVYDMFNPELPYTSRDAFPNGEGVNRRIGFADLNEEAQNYIIRQKRLSILNFINPSIFFINRIDLGNYFTFSLFTQYVPTHFGNDVALYLPLKYKDNNWLINIHRYENWLTKGYGLGVGAYNVSLFDRIEGDILVNYWKQPESFFSRNFISGGFLQLETRYNINHGLSIALGTEAKTKGWMLGEAELEETIDFHLGLHYHW